jgi:TRAP-type C4-dicarboxylate transport system permease small subunit
MQALKHEIKKIGSLTLFFFLSFGYILLIVKLFLKEYSIDSYVIGKALLGAIIAAKTVAILDATLKLEGLQNLPRYIGVLSRTSIYTLAALIIGSIEGFIEAYRGTRALPAAIIKFTQTESFYHILAVTLCLAVVFFLHNLWQEIDLSLGKGTLGKFFLSRPQSKTNRLG